MPFPTLNFSTPFNNVLAYSGGHEQGPFDLTYYLKGALAGGICCGVTHGALCPVDVVKTRIQLDPVKYNKGMVDGFKTVIKEEGAVALSTGLGPTVFGYFIQGWFKFGGVEFFKINQAQYFGVEKAWEYRFPIYLLSAACAEFIADIFLCPLEATRIKLVANPSYASGLLTAFPKIIKDEGIITGFYSGFGPILFKQVPYTMAKFAVQGAAAERMADAAGIDMKKASDGTKLGISLASGVVAGVAAAIISHPADTLLSLVNKPGAGGEGAIMTRLMRIAGEVGPAKLCLTGLGPRCVMIGSLTAGQFGIFDIVMNATGATKFHFTDPAELEH
jgi:solute carrier family 25 phosphate transporter 3